MRLTDKGAHLALALEAREPEVSSPDFSRWLYDLEDKVEDTSVTIQEALQQVGERVIKEGLSEATRERLWTSIAVLERRLPALDGGPGSRLQGGLIGGRSDPADAEEVVL